MADSTYHGLHVSFVQRPTTWASVRLTYTLSKSMNDVGEAFFSSPIDPTDIMRDWGRSDDDQRHRLVINGTVNSLDGAGHDGVGAHQPRIPGEQHAAVLLGAAFNITSGVTTSRERQVGRSRMEMARELRRAGRRIHPRKRRRRQRFLQPGACGSAVRSGQRRRDESKGWSKAFNLTNRVQRLTTEQQFRRRGVSDEPVSTFDQMTGVRRPEGGTIRRAREVLKREGVDDEDDLAYGDSVR